MKQSSQSEKRVPRKRVRPNRTAREREIVIMWAKRIAVAVMVLILLGQAYRLVAIYQEKQHIEQQLHELQMRNDELEQEKAMLQDPKTIEQVARDELGLVKPGEVPYVK
ncbi:FtsB family cell division protein [Veillonella caviae]|uniref:FtsB family cell division protein n=1 Tax=Veillonella caviae TaxID=248316 RepID=UPI002353655A|nr:septum formation initiator family protein [Veillonella caviae]MDY5481915.1 septum formation initiator family protein [Veillonella caviae]